MMRAVSLELANVLDKQYDALHENKWTQRIKIAVVVDFVSFSKIKNKAKSEHDDIREFISRGPFNTSKEVGVQSFEFCTHHAIPTCYCRHSQRFHQIPFLKVQQFDSIHPGQKV
jgi:hypothetical protein